MSAVNTTTTTTNTKRTYRKQPVVIKTFINTEQKKAIMKAFKNVSKAASKYNKKVEKEAKVAKREADKKERLETKKENMKNAKETVSNMNMDDKEPLLRHIYSDLFEAMNSIVGKFTKPKMAIFMTALDKKTTNTELTKAYLAINKKQEE
tara:strand:- start:2097 stop:2546 length:450 start_codon:yes stop_codon:yes gene_type:complete